MQREELSVDALKCIVHVRGGRVTLSFNSSAFGAFPSLRDQQERLVHGSDVASQDRERLRRVSDGVADGSDWLDW